ncbi:Lipase 3 [Blattella germanica]|nr:Lipase 3 [Blattella germanica]
MKKLFLQLLAYLYAMASETLAEKQELSLPSMPELVLQNNYPAEVHKVTTTDGYILTMHRIPYSPKSYDNDTSKPVVFLQHGLLSSSVDWVMLGPEKSLAYLLADEGYDVWMGNARGNMFSTNHTSLNPTNPSFWSFSWHEMGVYDLPAEIDYILETTGQTSISYVGHSMGTTMFFVLASSKLEYNAKISHVVALAPVAFLKHTKSPFASISRHLPKGVRNVIFDMVLNWPFFPNREFSNGLLKKFCKKGSMMQEMCTNTLFQIGGFNSEQLNQVSTMLPTILHYFPAGSSIKAWRHYGQLIDSGKFRKYDYELANLYKYGSMKPPKYNLKSINTWVSLIAGPNDWLATPEDVVLLQDELPNCEYYQVSLPKFNHFDFMWATDVKTLVNDNVISLLNDEDYYIE